MVCDIYDGIVEISDRSNIISIRKKIIENSCFSSENSKKDIVKRINKKLYDLEFFSEIYKTYDKFNINVLDMEDDFSLYSFIRSLSRCEEFERIKKISGSINFDSIKEYKEEIVRFTARSFTLTGDTEKSNVILDNCDEFKCCMLKIYNYSLSDDFDKIVKSLIYYKEKFTDIEEILYMDFILAKEFYKKNDMKRLKEVVARIRKIFYLCNNEYVITRSLHMHSFLILMGEKIEAYSFLVHAAGVKSLSRMELDNKAIIIKILVDDYDYNYEKVLKLSFKKESLENKEILRSKLQEELF